MVSNPFKPAPKVFDPEEQTAHLRQAEQLLEVGLLRTNAAFDAGTAQPLVALLELQRHTKGSAVSCRGATHQEPQALLVLAGRLGLLPRAFPERSLWGKAGIQLGPGDFCGVEAFFGSAAGQGLAIAEEDAVLAGLSVAALERLQTTQPGLANALTRWLAAAMAAQQRQWMALATAELAQVPSEASISLPDRGLIQKN